MNALDIVVLLILIFTSYKIGKKVGQRTLRKNQNGIFVPEPKKDTAPANMKLNPEQQQLFNKIESSRGNFFITGRAGTGKSFLLQYLKEHSRKRLVVTAFTGVAALHVGGQTLHSLFQLPISLITPSKLRISEKVAALVRHLDTIIIDEVSMVRVDLMNALDVLLRRVKKNTRPFGGLQIIVFGDPYQLPPVVEDEMHRYFVEHFGGPYFFNAPGWKEGRFTLCELKYMHRQQGDDTFKDILNGIRENKVTDELLEQLNMRFVDEVPQEGIIRLAPTNRAVEHINNRCLAALPGKPYQYAATLSGRVSEKHRFPVKLI